MVAPTGFAREAVRPFPLKPWPSLRDLGTQPCITVSRHSMLKALARCLRSRLAGPASMTEFESASFWLRAQTSGPCQDTAGPMARSFRRPMTTAGPGGEAVPRKVDANSADRPPRYGGQHGERAEGLPHRSEYDHGRHRQAPHGQRPALGQCTAEQRGSVGLRGEGPDRFEQGKLLALKSAGVTKREPTVMVNVITPSKLKDMSNMELLKAR